MAWNDVRPCTPYEPFIATWDDEQPIAAQCGQAQDKRVVDFARLLESAPPLDEATRERVRDIFALGKAQGRRADRFALVGDSITIDHAFLRPMSDRAVLSPAVRDALAVGPDRTIVDVFRASYDAFTAPRAAKIGARVKWAISYNAAMKATPVDDIVMTLSPAYAVVMYGTNDAQWWPPPLASIAREFKRELGVLLDALESRGVVPILTTIPKHGRDKRFPDCPTEETHRREAPDQATRPSNLRYAVQTNAVNAAIAEVACERRLPLIDYRWALEPLLDHGVAADGVHPSLYFKGGGVLDEHGLACGFNVRNFVTLLALKRVREATVTDAGSTP